MDETESKVRQWALRRNGVTLTVQDVVELALAIDDDATRRHDENVQRFSLHMAEAAVRDERIVALEGWRHEASTTCERRVLALIEKEHSVRHEAHLADDHPRRANDPPMADFRKERGVEDEELGDLRRAWRVMRWWVAALALVLTAMFAEWFMHAMFNIP